ncbi:MAG: LytR C-terminal domain-containing protein [Ilumatobacteraceae bacterium]
MTDAPEGQGAQAERGSGKRSQRVGDSGSPVGSTLSIVLAVVAVIAGFLILRAITDDDDDGGTDITLETTPEGSTPVGSDLATTTTGAGGSSVPVTTINKAAATVVVANASGIGGSAGAMTTALQTAGYTMGTAGNSTEGTLDASVVYYAVGDVTAQGVATAVATDMGGIAVLEMPAGPPIDSGLGTATVLVMLGTDTANKTLADLNPATVTPPAVAGGTTTTVAG